MKTKKRKWLVFHLIALQRWTVNPKANDEKENERGNYYSFGCFE